MATVDFYLTKLNATKIVTWKCHIDDSIDSRYDIILGRYLPTELVLDLNFSSHVIIGGNVPYKNCSAPMADVTDYYFKPLTNKIIKPE